MLMTSRARLAAVLVLGLTLAACGDTTADGDDEPVTVRLLTHDSFAVSDDVLADFTEETGIEVEVLRSGDAGSMVNQAILTAGNPQGDVLFGIDSTFLTRALEADLFVAHEAAGLEAVDPELLQDDEHRVTPVDYGDVCLNYDKAWFETSGVPVPTGLRGPDRSALPRPPRGAEPRHLVAGPRVPAGQRGHLRRGRVGDVVAGPARQRRAGGGRLGAGLQRRVLGRGGQRGRSAPRGVLRLQPAGGGALRGSARRRAAHRRHRRELLSPGRVGRDPGRHGSRGGGGGAGRLPRLRAVPGRRAAVDVRLPGGGGHRAARGVRGPRRPAHRRPGARPGHGGRPARGVDRRVDRSHAAADRPPLGGAPARPARRVPDRLLRVAGRQHHRGGPARRRHLGPLRGGGGARRRPPPVGRVVHLVAGGGLDDPDPRRRPADRPGALPVRVPRSTVRAGGARGALRAPDRGGGDGVPVAARPGQPARGRSPRLGVGDPARPRVLQPGRGRAHRRRALGGPRPPHGGGGPRAGRAAVAGLRWR